MDTLPINAILKREIIYNEIKKIQTIYRSLESRLYCEVDRKIVEEYETIEN